MVNSFSAGFMSGFSESIGKGVDRYLDEKASREKQEIEKKTWDERHELERNEAAQALRIKQSQDILTDYQNRKDIVDEIMTANDKTAVNDIIGRVQKNHGRMIDSYGTGDQVAMQSIKGDIEKDVGELIRILGQYSPEEVKEKHRKEQEALAYEADKAKRERDLEYKKEYWDYQIENPKPATFSPSAYVPAERLEFQKEQTDWKVVEAMLPSENTSKGKEQRAEYLRLKGEGKNPTQVINEMGLGTSAARTSRGRSNPQNRNKSAVRNEGKRVINKYTGEKQKLAKEYIQRGVDPLKVEEILDAK